MRATGVTDWIVDYLSGVSGLGAYGAIFGILFISGLGVPVPEDITLIAAGFLAGIGQISLPGALLAGFSGVLVADAILFFAGRHFGEGVFTIWPFSRYMTPERLAMAQERVQKDAKFICFIARFLPGLRSPIYLTAGALKIPPSTFVIQDGLAALISVPFWVIFGWYFGEEIQQALTVAKNAQRWLLLALALVILWYVLRRHRQRSQDPHAPEPGDLDEREAELESGGHRVDPPDGP